MYGSAEKHICKVQITKCVGYEKVDIWLDTTLVNG